MYQLIVGAGLSLMVFATVTAGQASFTAKANLGGPKTTAASETDRVRDGFIGLVRRVRTEVAKLSVVGGKIEEGKRAVLETAEYDATGAKTQNQYFPIAGATLTGREIYKYDDKGNISEMTLVNADGSLLSREVYKYEFDSVGNWVKMTTSVLVIKNDKIEFQPTEITYRTIFYYGSSETNTAVQLPPRSSMAQLKVAGIDPVAGNVAISFPDAANSVVTNNNELPPAPRVAPVSGGVLNGRAISLPPPAYPDIARRMHMSGKVEVQVEVDENGRVTSAHAVSGPNSLRDAAVQAATRARFSPTKVSGQPVKISGKIEYIFTHQ